MENQSNAIEVVDLSKPVQTYIEGYCVVWGDQTNLGVITEVIGENSFDWSDVVALYGHDKQSLPFGRVGAKTLSLTRDDTGIYAKALVPKSRTDLVEAIERGDVVGWSFDINEPEYQWSGRTGTLRKNTITEITLTPFPAYKKSTLKVTRN